ncbi:MAG: hypothetical protein C0524_08965 [Rhodobacter sp.]|nr:hypothetical protein [Rhodobacter sp.]
MCATSIGAPIWEGKFSDKSVREFIARFHYSSDAAAALGDERFALVRCPSCGMVYHARHADDAGLERIYRDWTDQEQVRRFEAEHRSPVAGEEGRQRIRTVLRLQHLARRQFAGGDALRLLDFGCGNGELMMAAQLLGFQPTGIDLSESRATAAHGAGRPIYPDLEAFDHSGQGAMHAVVLAQVLEHLVEPLGLLQALHERMLPGGGAASGRARLQGYNRPLGFRPAPCRATA